MAVSHLEAACLLGAVANTDTRAHRSPRTKHARHGVGPLDVHIEGRLSDGGRVEGGKLSSTPITPDWIGGEARSPPS
jgi:hypothetical protein